MTGSSSSYRGRGMSGQCVALSIAYEHDNMLARGMGLEHLRELLIRIARPILRQGGSLAYAGHWQEVEENFTFDLLRLISAEQEDNSLGGPDTSLSIGRLYNYSAWPAYEKITPAIEARWINFCTILRVGEAEAGIAPADLATAADLADRTPRAAFNGAVALSATRRLTMTGTSLAYPEVAHSDMIPPAIARVLLGGRIKGYSGFAPGIFEEALLTLEAGRSAYILGGFGGASQLLADAILAGGTQRPAELTEAWHRTHNPGLAGMLDAGFALPAGARATGALLDALFDRVMLARADLAALNTGLTPEDNRALLRTRDIGSAVRLVRRGLEQQNKLTPLVA